MVKNWYNTKNEGPPYGRAGKILSFVPVVGFVPPKFPEVSAEEANKDSMRGYHVVRKPGEEAAHAH